MTARQRMQTLLSKKDIQSQSKRLRKEYEDGKILRNQLGCGGAFDIACYGLVHLGSLRVARQKLISRQALMILLPSG